MHLVKGVIATTTSLGTVIGAGYGINSALNKEETPTIIEILEITKEEEIQEDLSTTPPTSSPKQTSPKRDQQPKLPVTVWEKILTENKNITETTDTEEVIKQIEQLRKECGELLEQRYTFEGFKLAVRKCTVDTSFEERIERLKISKLTNLSESLERYCEQQGQISHKKIDDLQKLDSEWESYLSVCTAEKRDIDYWSGKLLV